MKDWKRLKSGTDVRGVAMGDHVTLTAEHVRTLGTVFARFVAERTGRPVNEVTVALGRDSRVTGESLLAAAAEGVSRAGASVQDYGLCTTPAMFMSMLTPGFEPTASVMITASHLPPERNGMKFFLPGGGLRGTIDGQTILCGGTELMRLMNVRFPYRLVTKTSVLLAIDGVLYGIFNMKYEPNPTVRRALVGLIRSNRHPVFAIRDFNINPEMLHETFDVATDGYDFPPYVERFAMSEGTPGRDSKVAGVVCRDGLGPLSDTADVGRSIFVATRANMILTILGVLAGVLTAFVQLLRFGGVSIPFLFFFMLIWAIPVLLVGKILRLER